MRRPRRNHGAAFKARVALEALRGEQTLAELAQKDDVHATHVVGYNLRWMLRWIAFFWVSVLRRSIGIFGLRS